MEKLLKQKKAPMDVLQTLQKARAKKGQAGPGQATVYRFMNGETYKRNRPETRGKPASLSAEKVVQIADGTSDRAISSRKVVMKTACILR